MDTAITQQGAAPGEMPDLSMAPGVVLAVDLDGTLTPTDLLLEGAWAATAQDWRVPLRACGWALRGRAHLKRRLAACATPDLDHLPWRQEVLDLAAAWRGAGGRTALVTASDAQIAEAVAARHPGLFDEVHGSDGVNNLKGPAKAAFLADRYGTGGYAYVGDSPADMAAWRGAAQAITAGARAGLRARVDDLAARNDRPAAHLAPADGGLGPALREMRPHQWIKNVLIFAPMVAAHAFTGAAAMQAGLAFVAFALVASGVYVLNDLLDLGPDRAHPRKRNRPVASGALPITLASAMVPGLLLAGFSVAALLGWGFVLVAAGYLVATTAYSLWLKRRIVADIATLAGLYTLRIVAGGVAAGITLSVWLLALSIFLFFALAAVKRQAELVDAAERGLTNTTGRGYRVDDLPLVAQMATAAGFVAVLVLALYIDTPQVQAQYGSPAILWGVCLVLLYWVARIVMITHRGRMHDDPLVFAIKDPVSRTCLLLSGALVAAASFL